MHFSSVHIHQILGHKYNYLIFTHKVDIKENKSMQIHNSVRTRVKSGIWIERDRAHPPVFTVKMFIEIAALE